MIQHLALFAGGTEAGVVAGIHTTAVGTSKIFLAFAVLSALDLAIRTGEDTLLVNHQTVLAPAHRQVVTHNTLLIKLTAKT